MKNVGDRAAQVGSHYHFYEANEAGLQFDREKARGKRLDIPAGTAIRFEQVKRKQYNLLTLEGNVVFLVSITRSMVLRLERGQSMSFKWIVKSMLNTTDQL